MTDYFPIDPWTAPDLIGSDSTMNTSNIEHMWSPLSETGVEKQSFFYSSLNMPSTDPKMCIDPNLENSWMVDQEKSTENAAIGDNIPKRRTQKKKQTRKICEVSHTLC